MRLKSFHVERFRNILDSDEIDVDPTITCLVGKNESGKTTILKALHRLNLANGTDLKFDITTEYTQWRLVTDRRRSDCEDVHLVEAV